MEKLSVERLRLEEVAHIANIIKRAAEICRQRSIRSTSKLYITDYGIRSSAYEDLYGWLTTGIPTSDVLRQVDEEFQKNSPTTEGP